MRLCPGIGNYTLEQPLCLKREIEDNKKLNMM
jgi:hypothetical protein